MVQERCGVLVLRLSVQESYFRHVWLGHESLIRLLLLTLLILQFTFLIFILARELFIQLFQPAAVLIVPVPIAPIQQSQQIEVPGYPFVDLPLDPLNFLFLFLVLLLFVELHACEQQRSARLLRQGKHTTQPRRDMRWHLRRVRHTACGMVMLLQVERVVPAVCVLVYQCCYVLFLLILFDREVRQQSIPGLSIVLSH